MVLYKIEYSSNALSAESSDREAAVYKFVADHGEIVRRDVEKMLNVSPATATRILTKMVEAGKLKRIGDARNVKYIKIV